MPDHNEHIIILVVRDFYNETKTKITIVCTIPTCTIDIANQTLRICITCVKGTINGGINLIIIIVFIYTHFNVLYEAH